MPAREAQGAAGGVGEGAPEPSGPGGGAASPPARRRLPLSGLSLLIAVVLAAAGVLGYVLTRRSVDLQEKALLREDTSDAAAYVSAVIEARAQVLTGLAASLPAGGISQPAFAAKATPFLTPNATLALLSQSGDAYMVVAAVGPALTQGSAVTGTVVTQLAHATSTPTVAIMASNRTSSTISWAFGPPLVPAGFVLYERVTYSPYATRAGKGAPFAQLESAVYDAAVADADKLVLATTTRLPLRGAVASSPVRLTSGTWLLVARARATLVGRFAADAPLILLVLGWTVAAVVAGVTEVLVRRRRYAERLVAERSLSLLRAQEELLSAERDRARLEEMERIAVDLQHRVVQKMLHIGSALQATAARHPSAGPALSSAIDDVDATARELRGAIYGLAARSDPPGDGGAPGGGDGAPEPVAAHAPELSARQPQRE